MVFRRLVVGILSGSAFLISGPTRGQEAGRGFRYPDAPRSDTVDDYHGTKVADPYRPLEDPDAPATRRLGRGREQDHLRLPRSDSPAGGDPQAADRALGLREVQPAQIEEGDATSSPTTRGCRTRACSTRPTRSTAEPRVLLDPNTLSAGRHGRAGRDRGQRGRQAAWPTGSPRPARTGTSGRSATWPPAKDLADHLKWIKFSSAAWTPDGKGFFYGRFPEPKPGEDLKGANYYQKRLLPPARARPQKDDALVWEDPEHKEWRADPTVTDDGKYLILTVGKGTDAKYRVLYRPLADPSAKPVHLVGEFDAEYQFIDNDGPVFWFKTNKNAPRGKVVAIDTRSPEPEHWVDADSRGRRRPSSPSSVVADHFLATYLKDAHNGRPRLRPRGQARPRRRRCPGLGTAAGFHGKRKDKETFYAFTSFTAPADDLSLRRRQRREQALAAAEARSSTPPDYETTQVFYPSKDGTKIPMFLSHKKGLKRDGTQPDPALRLRRVQHLAHAQLQARQSGLDGDGRASSPWPNLRGGGEYGEDWHQAGTKLEEAERLRRLHRRGRVADRREVHVASRSWRSQGRSNGGLLVGACMTQRPDLFGACLPAVGVMDMLRFHKFTIGWAWVDDYGSSDDPEQFKALFAYSPLHNIKPGTCYPPTLITTADHDDRVVPAHSFKFAAALAGGPGVRQPDLDPHRDQGRPRRGQADDAS